MLTLQPTTAPSLSSIDEHPIPNNNDSKKLPPLLFPVQNFFAAGSPLGVILLLRGFKIASRKSLGHASAHAALSDVKSPSPSSINLCYPAVDNLYNIFHKVSINTHCHCHYTQIN
jgi:hypothetical protein